MYNNNLEFEELLRTNTILSKAMKTIYKLAKEDKSEPFYKEHFIPCANICLEMSYIKGIDKIDAILIGLFHDVGKFMIKENIDNHEVVGAEYAEKFLINNQYSGLKAQIIKQAIINHRKNANENLDKMSKLIINADIISYVLHKKYFYKYLLNFNVQNEASKIVNKKILESYERMDEDGKKMMFRLLIDNEQL